MAEREELKGRDDKYRKDEPDSSRSGSRTEEPDHMKEPGRLGRGNPDRSGSQPGSPRKGTGSDSEEKNTE